MRRSLFQHTLPRCLTPSLFSTHSPDASLLPSSAHTPPMPHSFPLQHTLPRCLTPSLSPSLSPSPLHPSLHPLPRPPPRRCPPHPALQEGGSVLGPGVAREERSPRGVCVCVCVCVCMCVCGLHSFHQVKKAVMLHRHT